MDDKFKIFLDAQEALANEKKKTIKRGENVIHLEYIGEIDDNDLLEIDSQLNESGFRLGWYDKSGLAYNNLEDYSFTTFVVLNNTIIVGLISGIISSASWDAIKCAIGTIWGKIRGKKQNIIRSKQPIIEKEITFGVEVVLDKNTQLNFELKGNLDKEIIMESLDKAIDFLRTETPNKAYKIPDFAYYNPELKKWIKIDVMEEHRKKANKKK